MRVGYTESNYHSYGDFSIYAENETDRAILKNFISPYDKGDKSVVFKLHSHAYIMSEIGSFHFGWCKATAKFRKRFEREKAKRHALVSSSLLILGLVLGALIRRWLRD